MKRYFFGFSLFAVLFLGSFVGTAKGATTAELEALITSLQKQIAELTLQLKEQQNGEKFCHAFNADLTFGSSGADVLALKKALGIGGFDMDLAPEFNENAASGVVQFQRKHGIRQTGYVGPLTRAKLNALHGCTKKEISAVPVIRSLSLSRGPVGTKIMISGSGFSLRKNIVLLRSVGEAGASFVASDVVASPDGSTLTVALSEGGGYLCGQLLESSGGFACALLYRAFTPGSYKLLVASAPHESQSNEVDFEVTSAVVAPSISITSPGAGDVWRVGDTRRIAWKSTGIKNFKAYLVGHGNDGFVNLVELPNSKALSRSESHYDWLITNQDIPIRTGSGLTSITPSQFLDFYQIRIDEADGMRSDGSPAVQAFSKPFTLASGI